MCHKQKEKCDMKVADFCIFFITATIGYSIWTFIWYFYIRHKYNQYLDTTENPKGKIQFIYEGYHLNRLYWAMYENHKNWWIYRQKVYDTFMMIRCIVFLIIGAGLLFSLMYFTTTDYSVFLDMSI